MLLWLGIGVLFFAQAHCLETEARVVATDQGPVRGYREDELFAFYSIPYATAPTGLNKFKPPFTPPVWEEPFEAVDKGIICVQPEVPNVVLANTVQQEDCLIASVFVPDTDETNLPVIVIVHGGGYMGGYGNLLTPKGLARSKRVIAVTFNYRVGIQGFLCLGTENIPGNAGSKDQLAMLRWVNRNIANFGGNPNDVTISGYSAGGSSVDLLMLSKAATGLFHKVIPDSGTNVAVWSVQINPIEMAKEFAKHVGFDNVDDFQELENFYLSASWEEILDVLHYVEFPNSLVGFTPCVERDTGGEKFLDDAPVNVLKNGDYNKVPMLYGFTDMEGLLRVQNGLFDRWKVQMNDNFSDFMPADLQFESEEQKEEVAKQIKEFYFGDQEVNEETVSGYVDFFTDVAFAYPTLRAVKLHVEAGHDKIYLYEYAFVAEEKFFVPSNINVRGADHTDQTWIVLDGVERIMGPVSERTMIMNAAMREMWLNFITAGTPVPAGSELTSWAPVGEQRGPHMYLNETFQQRGPLYQERAEFWDAIYERYYRMPVPPNNEVQQERLVPTAQGPVRGYREDGVFVFYSIPYATAPVGEDRYKAPTDGPTWVDPFEAVDSGIVCPQMEGPGIVNTVNQQEDCLVTTVYTPDTEETNLPVVVYVHGGGYLIGFGNLLQPKHLVRTKRVIAITFNYRLGVHGFLCLGTEDIPGNAGMKDQVALLRWVNKNIAGFGGNPDDVTIAGYSAGASAVDLLMLSKSTSGLFHKVIPESGSNVAVWSLQMDPLETAKEFARDADFTNVDDIEALEQFYKSASLEVITNVTHYMLRTDATFGFTPCLERDEGVERFLDDTPVNILREGNYNKVPILYGFTDMEGLLRVHDGLFDIWHIQMNEKFSNFLPADLQFESEEQREEIAADIKQFYFSDNLISEDTVLGYIDYFTDVYFAYPTLRAIKLHLEAGHDKIFLYEYSFVAEEKFFVAENIQARGADHTDQTWIILDGVGSNESILSERTLKMKSEMRELWLNFIETGTPVPAGSALPTWPPVGAQRAPHMSLNETSLLLGALHERRMQFWEGIYERHYRTPVAPSSATIAYINYFILCILFLKTIIEI